MRTETHVYLCMVPSDWLYSAPYRLMPPKEAAEYVIFRLLRNGFDLSRSIDCQPKAGNVIFSQEIEA